MTENKPGRRSPRDSAVKDAKKTLICQLNGQVFKTIKRDFDIRLLQNSDIPGHDRDDVLNHMLKYYTLHGLPKIEE